MEEVGSTRVCPRCKNATLTLVKVPASVARLRPGVSELVLEWRCRCGHAEQHVEA